MYRAKLRRFDVMRGRLTPPTQNVRAPYVPPRTYPRFLSKIARFPLICNFHAQLIVQRVIHACSNFSYLRGGCPAFAVYQAAKKIGGGVESDDDVHLFGKRMTK